MSRTGPTKAPEYVGKRFGRLLVTEFVGRNKHGQALLKCDCDCGKTIEVSICNLSTGCARSCGCLRRRPEAARIAVLAVYRSAASKRGYQFNLTDEEAKVLMEQPCFYCGLPPSNVKTLKFASYTYSGIDRADNTGDYVVDNCVPCCADCNIAKRSMPLEQWFGYIERLTNHNGLK